MSIRKLASIQRILDIQPIPDADSIEVATINSWRVVVKKGEFKVGDLVIYAEVDCWIPHALAPFLSKGQYPRVYDGVEGERLKTVKLRGQISQGLILPLYSTDGIVINGFDEKYGEVKEGDDVSEFLSIVKYEPPVLAQLAGISLGAFPSQIPKTDEERCQNFSADEWKELSQYWYVAEEKLDGSSCTMALIDGEFKVCSRNINLKDVEGNTFWEMARKYDVEAKLRANGGDNIAIQGEVCGENIQDNKYKLKGHHFYCFSMYSINQGAYVSPSTRTMWCDKNNIPHVPIIDSECHLTGMSVDEVLLQSDGMSKLCPTTPREGIVYKKLDNPSVHWKAISNKFLLKFG